jgi:hypothetical protein
MEYQDLSHLRQDWLSGNFQYPDTIDIAGIPYKHQIDTQAPKFEDVILRGSKGFVIYTASSTHKEEAAERGLHQWIVFLWGSDDNLNITPYDIRTVSPSRFTGNRLGEGVETLGDVAIVKFFLPSGVGAVKGKVDTGADISSLHADNISIVGETVKFSNSELSPNTISMPVADHHAVKSADGGVVYRPVIELDIEINGKTVRNALFNLNDRNHMDYPCLIGQNILEKTGFLIDPRKNDPDRQQENADQWVDDIILEQDNLDVNYQKLCKEFDGVVAQKFDNVDREKLVELYNLLENTNLSFPDLLRFMRTELMERIEKIQY